MSMLNDARLTEGISQLLLIPDDTSFAMIEEINMANIPYRSIYGDFQSGGWHTATLYSPIEGGGEGLVHDGTAKPTQLATRLPTTMGFLESLSLQYFAVRIARMDSNSYLWEHSDYIELDQDKARLRLHVPLVTNPGAVAHFPGLKVHMAHGWMWKLDPTVSHAASNSGPLPRIHLVLDCYMEEHLREMLHHEVLDRQYVQRLPKLGNKEKQTLLGQAEHLLKHDGIEKAEQHLLKSFHQYDLEETSSYDLLADFYHNMGFSPREKYWIGQHIFRLHNRGKLNGDAEIINPGTISISELHGSSAKSDQFRILTKVLTMFEPLPGLEKAFVRGSLARGNVDLHSDIDLLCEVRPREFAAFIEQADNILKSSLGAVGGGLVDTVVKDFGGIGMIYMLETEGRLYQLDLYLTCQGRPWGSDTFKREVFRRTHDLGKSLKYENLEYRLHAEEIDLRVRQMQNVEPTVEHTLLELHTFAVMLKKCLVRDDIFVAQSEYNIWIACFIKLIRQKFDTQYRDYGFYHVKRLANEVGDGGVLFENLRAMLESPLTSYNFDYIYCIAVKFAMAQFPDECEKQRKLIDTVSRHIGGWTWEDLKDGPPMQKYSSIISR